MTQSERLLELEVRIKKLEEIISYNQRDLEALCNSVTVTQEHLASIYNYLADLNIPEVHNHYYKVTYNYPPEERKD